MLHGCCLSVLRGTLIGSSLSHRSRCTDERLVLVFAMAVLLIVPRCQSFKSAKIYRQVRRTSTSNGH